VRPVALILTFLVLMVAVTATALAAAATAKPFYVYTGRTTQRITIRLAAEQASARWFRYRAKMACTDGSTFLDDYFSDDVPVNNNRFSVSDTSNAGAITTKVTGILSGKHASGTIRIIERYSADAVNGVTPLAANGAIVCDSQSVKWSATA
jgi:hypothetical protein